MKPNEFINKYINTKVDYDKLYGAQCVDLFRQYCEDVLDIPHTGSCSTTGGAIDLFLDYEKMPLEKMYFAKIQTNKVKDLKFGDFIIYDKTDKNPYGHVALFIAKIDDKNTLVFEQNGMKQDGAKMVIRSIDNALGVLRFE